MNFKLILSTFLMIVFSSCANQVGQLKPEPKPGIGLSYEVLEFQMGDDVKQDFNVAATQDIPEIKVSDYRKSFINGFLRAYKDHFKGNGDKKPKYAIFLDQADLSFHKSKLNTSVIAVIKYKARLVSKKSGKTVLSSNRKVRSKERVDDIGKASDAVKTAMESLFEKVGQDFFKKKKKKSKKIKTNLKSL